MASLEHAPVERGVIATRAIMPYLFMDFI